MKKNEQENYGLHALQSLELVLKNQRKEMGEVLSKFAGTMADAFIEALGAEESIATMLALWCQAIENMTYGQCAENKESIQNYVEKMAFMVHLTGQITQVLVSSRAAQVTEENKKNEPIVKLH